MEQLGAADLDSLPDCADYSDAADSQAVFPDNQGDAQIDDHIVLDLPDEEEGEAVTTRTNANSYRKKSGRLCDDTFAVSKTTQYNKCWKILST